MKLFKTYKTGVKDLPFILLFIDLIWWILSLFGLYTIDFWWITEITSHSLAFVAFMAFYAHVHKYCLYSWVCIIGLGLVNILNLIHYFAIFDYIIFYAGLIIITSLSFAVIKWRQSYYK